jgi:hypothetical protein
VRRSPVLVLLALALVAPAAAAAAPKALSLDPNGHRPRVAVNGAGTGFFTWTTPAGANDVFHYCRVLQGAKTCNASFFYAPPDGDVTGGYALFAPGGRVLLVDQRDPSGTKQVLTSTNGGTNFSGPVSPGSMPGTGDNIAGQAIYTPAGSFGRLAESIMTVSDVETIGVTFQATSTVAGSETATANLGSGPGGVSGGSYQGSLAGNPATNTLVATFATLSPANLYWRQWRHWTGGELNAEATWTRAELVDSTNVYSTAKLVSGKSGIYVAYARGEVNNSRFRLRRFTGSGWGPALALTKAGNPANGDLSESPNGILHFAWQENGKLRYRYARSPANTQFTSPQTLGGPNGNFPFLKLDVSGAGHGWITWEDIPGIRAVPVHPGEPPYTKPNRQTTVNFGSKNAVLSSPKNCVGPGQKFVAKVTGTANIKKVVFSIDGTKRAVKQSKPFRATLGTKGLASGVHHVKAAVTATFKKNGKKKTDTKDIVAPFSIC